MPALMPVILLAVGCGGTMEAPSGLAVSPNDIGANWQAVQPEGLLDLVEAPADMIPLGLTCPSVQVNDGVETWTGGCAQLDGTVIDGTLQRYDGPDSTWVSGQHFAVIRGDRLDLYFDGAVELTGQGELLQLDAAATTCGAHVDCASGMVSLDLHYDLRIDDDVPGGLADASLRGVVSVDGAEPAAVEGAWRLDPDTCDQEPVDGLFAVMLDQRQTLELDGDTACDGCGQWTVQGVVAPTWCPTQR